MWECWSEIFETAGMQTTLKNLAFYVYVEIYECWRQKKKQKQCFNICLRYLGMLREICSFIDVDWVCLIFINVHWVFISCHRFLLAILISIDLNVLQWFSTISIDVQQFVLIFIVIYLFLGGLGYEANEQQYINNLSVLLRFPYVSAIFEKHVWISNICLKRNMYWICFAHGFYA